MSTNDRIIIIGGPRTGKTTLAHRMAADARLAPFGHDLGLVVGVDRQRLDRPVGAQAIAPGLAPHLVERAPGLAVRGAGLAIQEAVLEAPALAVAAPAGDADRRGR